MLALVVLALLLAAVMQAFAQDARRAVAQSSAPSQPLAMESTASSAPVLRVAPRRVRFVVPRWAWERWEASGRYAELRNDPLFGWHVGETGVVSALVARNTSLWAILHGLADASELPEGERVCAGCGCHQHLPCEGGCEWETATSCSACSDGAYAVQCAGCGTRGPARSDDVAAERAAGARGWIIGPECVCPKCAKHGADAREP